MCKNTLATHRSLPDSGAHLSLQCSCTLTPLRTFHFNLVAPSFGAMKIVSRSLFLFLTSLRTFHFNPVAPSLGAMKIVSRHFSSQGKKHLMKPEVSVSRSKFFPMKTILQRRSSH